MASLKENIQQLKKSVIGIGFKPTDKQITILGSGFVVGQNIILTAAHLYQQLNIEQRKTLVGMALVKSEEDGLDTYAWSELEVVKEDIGNDLATLRFKNLGFSLLTEVELGDSDNVSSGDEAYFIGFPYAAQLINDGLGVTLIANKGMISNIKREGASKLKNWFIIDAISNPGNSGCPLVDVKTNKVIGVMTISFRIGSKTVPQLDIREPMHIAGAKPINLAKSLFS